MARAAVIVPALLVVGLIAFNGFSSAPTDLGLQGGRLAGCPDSPNCVSSESEDRRHLIEPLHFTGPSAPALASLKEVLRHQPRATLVLETNGYLRAEFRSAFFRFADDVEFFATGAVIQVRSASRVGTSDYGVNRRRVEAIREQFNAIKK